MYSDETRTGRHVPTYKISETIYEKIQMIMIITVEWYHNWFYE